MISDFTSAQNQRPTNPALQSEAGVPSCRFEGKAVDQGAEQTGTDRNVYLNPDLLYFLALPGMPGSTRHGLTPAASAQVV